MVLRVDNDMNDSLAFVDTVDVNDLIAILSRRKSQFMVFDYLL